MFFSEGNKGQVTGNCSNWLVKVIWVETAVLMPLFDQDLVDRCHFQELGNCSTKEVMIFRPKQGYRAMPVGFHHTVILGKKKLRLKV